MLNRGNTQSVTLRKPLPVTDVTMASTIVSQSDSLAPTETLGATGSIMAKFAPIASSNGDLVGKFGDTSLAISSTALTTEVSFDTVRARAGANQNNQDVTADYTAYLTAGEFYVIYETGRIYYCTASDSGAATVDYKYRGAAGSIIAGDVEIGAVEIKDASNDYRAAVVQTGADGESNTSNKLGVFAWLKAFNGSTWDRLRAGITACTATLTGWLNTLPWAVYNATPTTRTEGQGGPLQANSLGSLETDLQTKIAGEDLTNDLQGVQNKPVAVSTYAWSVDKSAALEASSIAKATAGVLRFSSFRLDSTAPSGTYYLQTMNSATLPADGAVTLLVAPTKIVHVSGVDDAINLDFTMNGIYASAGIVTVLSSTEFTKTISGAYLSGTNLYI